MEDLPPTIHLNSEGNNARITFSLRIREMNKGDTSSGYRLKAILITISVILDPLL